MSRTYKHNLNLDIASMKNLVLIIFFLFSVSVFAGTKVLMKTSMGDISIELFDKKSKESVRNFLQYVDNGFYTNVIFHRVIKDYIVQAGSLDRNFAEKKTLPQIKNDAMNMVKNLKGTIAMARKKHKHSAKSQFFFNLKDNPNLDHKGLGLYGYAVFGKIIKGLDVAIKIGAVKSTDRLPYKNVPVEPIIIQSISRI